MRILRRKLKCVRSFCNMTIKGILIGTLIAIVGLALGILVAEVFSGPRK